MIAEPYTSLTITSLFHSHFHCCDRTSYPRDSDSQSEPFKELLEAHMDVYRDCISHAKIIARDLDTE